MEEDERKEAAIAKAAALQPEFSSKSLKQEQIDKFKELHEKRLQMKVRTKIHNNSLGNTSGIRKKHKKDIEGGFDRNCDSTVISEESGNLIPKGNSDIPSLQLDKFNATVGTKKQQKLHWGLDTKERWERKANM